jgi:hypothetical protein
MNSVTRAARAGWMLAVGGLLVLGMVAPARAAVQRLGRVEGKVNPGSSDVDNFGVAAWKSGRMTYGAARLPDGRIRVHMHARLVVVRRFLAEMVLSPCNASYNPATPLTPDTYPLQPLPTWMGTDVTATKQMHKGVNELRLSGIVSSDQRFAAVPRHWTDCAAANVSDQDENDKAAVEAMAGDANRVNTTAFNWVPLILTVTSGDGQHL